MSSKMKRRFIMVKNKSKKSKFRGAVLRNAKKQSQGAQYGYLNLPKGVSMFKEEPKSRINLDILPYEVTSEVHPDRDDEYGFATPGSLWFKRPYWLHRNVGPNSESIVCPTSIKQKCPICEHRQQLLKEGLSWDDDVVRSLKPTQRNLYAVIPKGNKNYEEKIHIWDISQFLFQAKLNEEVQENEEYETFPDLEEGYTLRIRFSEESFGSNKFADTSRIDFIERTKPYDESILDSIPPLDDLLNIQSYKAISAQFFGNLSADEVEEDDDAAAEKLVGFTMDMEDEEENEDMEEVLIEEEEEEEEEEEDEEEEEKAPPKTRKTEKRAEKNQKVKSGKKDDCPYGHVFGKDVDDHEECDACDQWEACMDASS
jgi:hypothetical protein